MIRDELARRLNAHAPSDAREVSFRGRMLDLVKAEAPFDRATVDPGHFTASAFVLSPERDALLLIFHRKLGLWLQPGGHVEASDTSVLAAARREVEEEVGLTELSLESPAEALFDIDIHPIPARPTEAGHEHFDVRFLFVARSRQFAASEEVAGARWVSLDELAALTSDESVLRAARKIGSSQGNPLPQHR